MTPERLKEIEDYPVKPFDAVHEQFILELIEEIRRLQDNAVKLIEEGNDLRRYVHEQRKEIERLGGSDAD